MCPFQLAVVPFLRPMCPFQLAVVPLCAYVPFSIGRRAFVCICACVARFVVWGVGRTPPRCLSLSLSLSRCGHLALLLDTSVPLSLLYER